MKPVPPRPYLSGAFTQAALILATLVLQAQASRAQQAVILLRHAEQTLVGAMMDGDPPLNEFGWRRAEALGTALKEAGITAVVTSPYARSRQTAEPLARALGLEPAVLAKDDLPALVATLKARHAGDTVLVVAHSDTIPPLLKLWGHEASVEVGKAEFNSLWLVVPREGKPPLVSRLKL